MRNRTYGGVRGRKTKVGENPLRFPPTRFCLNAKQLDKANYMGMRQQKELKSKGCLLLQDLSCFLVYDNK